MNLSNVNQHNFDWNVTDRELVVFIPNYGRKEYIEATLERFWTNIPRKDWLILVVNDCIDEDFSTYEDYNLKYFTFDRTPKERNGAMIRNFVIKNTRSRLLMSRDPEIILHSKDALSRSMKIENEVIRANRAIELMEHDTNRIFKDPTIDVSKLKPRREYPVNRGCHEGFHFCFCAPSQTLRDLGGYEEAFADYYGYEDVEMLDRLKMHTSIEKDKDLIAYHIHHPRRIKFLRGVRDSAGIYKQIRGQKTANNGRVWGEG